MIRVLYMSDLHLEMERWRLNLPGWTSFMARHRALAAHPARGPMLDDVGPVDLVVLAGDIHNGLRGVVYADQLARYLQAPVVMVAGNHEFYHQQMDRLLPAFGHAAEKTAGRVNFLENGVARFDIKGRRLNVFGATLWTDYALHDTRDASMQAALMRMNDHRFIMLNGLHFRPRDALTRHEASRLWLHKALANAVKKDSGASNLVVSHHAPSGLVLGERTGDIAPAYGSDLLAEFAPWKPEAWIHGHTHYRHDSVADGLRIVSAPRGYVGLDGEPVLRYVPGLIEI